MLHYVLTYHLQTTMDVLIGIQAMAHSATISLSTGMLLLRRYDWYVDQKEVFSSIKQKGQTFDYSRFSNLEFAVVSWSYIMINYISLKTSPCVLGCCVWHFSVFSDIL